MKRAIKRFFRYTLGGERNVGLVLSGGGARGCAHLGVIKVLEQEGIPISIISGTSSGALFGACFAQSKNIYEIEDYVLGLAKKRLYSLKDIKISKGGIIKADKISDIIDHFLYVKEFKDLKIPLLVHATNLMTGETVVFNEGSLKNAIRGSISIPGVFDPIEVDGKIFVDGGVTNPLPIDSLRQYPLDLIIAVDVIDRLHIDPKKFSFLDVYRQSFIISQREIMKLKSIPNVLIIKPDLKNITDLNMKYAQEFIYAGEDAARKKLPEIRRRLGLTKTFK